MEQCKCGQVKIWCPFHGANRKEGLKELFRWEIASIDNQIELLQKRKNKLIGYKPNKKKA